MSPSPADPSPSTPSSSGQSSRKRKAAREDRGQDVSHDPALDGSGKQQPSKANKACLNCRKQKMKCEMDHEPPCRRCKSSKVPCLFKVRANGIDAGDWYISDLGASDDASMETFKTAVLNRLQVIEARLGIGAGQRQPSAGPTQPDFYPSAGHSRRAIQGQESEPGNAAGQGEHEIDEMGAGEPETETESLPDLKAALDRLVAFSLDKGHEGWKPHVVEALWMAFAENMPPLHFSTHQVFLDRPTPILLASVLYAASMQHPLTECAQLAPFYRAAAARAIAELAIPSEHAEAERTDAEDLHNALGIIITGIMSEAWVETTGVWISMAYQMILAGATRSVGARSIEWRGLYEGLRVIDIEHASLRMMCPLLPLTPPLACLESPSSSTTNSTSIQKQAYPHLTTIMHVGLSHFSGRHLPTIMETVLGTKNSSPSLVPAAVPYTAQDAKVIKGWAKELDNWLLRYHKPTRGQQRGPSEANIILLQYQLHKLFVLSIYHPVRGVDVTKDPSSPERKELLAAARAALQLQRMGLSVWSNWDLVIITSAALIVLDCLKDGVADRGDRLLIQGHINALRTTHQPAPNLRHTLAARLEERLQALTSPTMNANTSPFDTGSLEYLSIFNVDAEARVADTLMWSEVAPQLQPPQLPHVQHQYQHQQLRQEQEQDQHQHRPSVDGPGSTATTASSSMSTGRHSVMSSVSTLLPEGTVTLENGNGNGNGNGNYFSGPPTSTTTTLSAGILDDPKRHVTSGQQDALQQPIYTNHTGELDSWWWDGDYGPTVGSASGDGFMSMGIGAWPPAFQRVMGSLAGAQDASSDA